MFNKGSIVRHKKTGVELVVKSSNSTCSTCEYLHSKDYIQSKFMGVKSVVKTAICLNENLELSCTCYKTTQMCSCSNCENRNQLVLAF